MVNWNREGGSVFLIMFKTRHALPLPGGRFSCPRIGRGAGAERLRNMNCSWPQTRHLREYKMVAFRTRKRIARDCERSVSAFNSCQQACSLTVRIRDGATAATVLEPASAMVIKCSQAIRRHDLSTPANPPRILTTRKFKLARNNSQYRNGSSTSWPASFPAHIQIIPHYEHV